MWIIILPVRWSFPDLTDYNLMNAREKLATEVAAGLFQADPESNDIAEAQSSLDKIYNAKLNNVALGVDTYWLSKPLRTVFNQKHSLYLDGGTENLRWGADLSYTSGEGVMKGSFRDRMAGGLSFVLSAWLFSSAKLLLLYLYQLRRVSLRKFFQLY